MNGFINVLHLTDLHFSRHDRHDLDIVSKALKEDLKKICDSELKPDLIIFSGDLVQSADDPDIYYYLHDLLLDDVMKTTKCSTKRVFIAPGNHDVHRKIVQKNEHLQSGIVSDLVTRELLNADYSSGRLTEYISEKFAAFSDFSRLLDTGTTAHEDPFVRVFSLQDLGLDLVLANTAWASWAGTNKKSDQHTLLFPEAAIDKATSKCGGANVRIIAGHHPLSWLADFCNADIGKQISSQFHAHLFGHLHEPEPILRVTAAGSLLEHQGGALYSGRRHYNGYAIVSIDRQTKGAVVTLRSYFDKRRQFGPAHDIVDDGMFCTTKTIEETWAKEQRAVNKIEFGKWLAGKPLEEGRIIFNENLSERPLCNVFVPPPMYVPSTTEGTDPAKTQVSIQIDDVINSSRNYVIYGKRETGKSSLLKQIGWRILEASSTVTNPQLPVLIEFSDIKPGSNRIQRLIRAAMPGDEDAWPLKDLLTAGLVAVLVDDVDLRKATSTQLLREFINMFPKVRFIFTSARDEMEHFAAVTQIDTNVAFENVFINPFTRRKLRNLVEKYNLDGTADKDELLKRIMQEIVFINVPVTAVNGAILLTILQSKPGARPINRAVLIERFVETLLQKLELSEAEYRTFDYKMKVHFLAFVAASMAKSDTYVLELEKAISLGRSYFDKFGLNFDAVRILEYFVMARVLERKSDNRISFRYRAFLEFFIGYQMHLEVDFREWVLGSERYLLFLNEVQYYSGLSRTDSSLLKLISERFEKLTRDVFVETTWTPDLRLLSGFRPPVADTESEFLDDLEEQLKRPPLSDDERDDVLEAEFPKDIGNRQEVFRPKYSNVVWMWNSALILYSNILKNMELVPDGEKRAHLKQILAAWGIFTFHAIGLVPTLARQRKIVINGVTYEIILPKHLTDAEAARYIYLGMPSSISQLINRSLATEKLERQLQEPLLIEAEEPEIVGFYRTTLCADLRLSHWMSIVEKFSKRLRNSGYLLESLLWRLRDMYMLESIKSDESKQLVEVIGDSVGHLRGRNSSDRAQYRSKEIARMERLKNLRLLTSMQTDGEPIQSTSLKLKEKDKS